MILYVALHLKTFYHFSCIENYKKGIWLSATDEDHEGCWVWATPNISEMDQQYWQKWEPNNNNQNEHCSIMYSLFGYKLADADCSNNWIFFCKRRRGVYPILPTLEQVHAAHQRQDICWKSWFGLIFQDGVKYGCFSWPKTYNHISKLLITQFAFVTSLFAWFSGQSVNLDVHFCNI